MRSIVAIHPRSFLRDRVILPIQGCAIFPQKILSNGIPQRISSQNGGTKTPESASAYSSCSPMDGNPSAKEGTAAIFLQQPLLHLIFLLAISPGHQLPLSAFAPCKPPGPSVFLVCLPGTAAIFRGAEGAMKGDTLRKRFFLILCS